jgi:hypothetical protein
MRPSPGGDPWEDRPRRTDLTKARAYTERYRYDAMGNMLRLEHRNQLGGFTREFTVEGANNRLRQMKIGTDAYDYTFDASGNMLSEAASRHFEWSHSDRMKAFRTQTEGTEPPAKRISPCKIAIFYYASERASISPSPDTRPRN